MLCKRNSVMSGILLLVIGCAGGIMHTKKSLPDWYLNTPDEETALYGIGESEGQDLGLTRQAAEAGARDEIARQVEIKISNMITSSMQAVGNEVVADVVRTASSQVASLTASHIKILEREVIISKGGYIVYALAKMPVESLKIQAQQALEQEEMQRQLNIDAEMQKMLAAEVAKLDGRRQ